MSLRPDTAGLDERWHATWPGCRPIAHELRTAAPDRWVRFHSLRGAKRYPEDAAERAEVLARHDALLTTLDADDLLVVTCSWGGHEVVERTPPLVAADPDASPWRSEPTDPDQREDWTHLWVSRRSWRPRALDDLLALVVDDRTGGVIVAPITLRWLYHPYDGGADLLMRDRGALDTVATRHAAWRSGQEHGL